MSSPSVNLGGFLQPHPRVSQFSADPILFHPGLINAGRRGSWQLELSSDRVLPAERLWIAREIWHVPN